MKNCSTISLRCLLFTFLPLLLSFTTLAQERVISGLVTSKEDGMAVPGANVVIKGTSIGTITGPDGRYSLNVPDDAETMVVSFIGLVPAEIPINGQTVIDVAMITDAKQL